MDFDSETEKNRFTLYAVADGNLLRYVFTYDNLTETVTLATVIERQSSFDGGLIRIKVTNNFVVVSCADCSTPRVTLYDKQLNQRQTFAMEL